MPSAIPGTKQVPTYVPKAKKAGFISKTYNRLGSTTDSALSIADNGMHASATFVQSLEPMALEVLNEAKSDLVESVINLALARKNAEQVLISAGYTPAEVAEMLHPTK